MKKQHPLPLLLCLIFLTSCSPIKENVTQQETLVISPTFLEPLPTATYTRSPTPRDTLPAAPGTPEFQIITSCVTMLPDRPSEFISEGTMIFRRLDKERSAVMLDLQTNQTKPLPYYFRETIGGYVTVSQDRRWMAYKGIQDGVTKLMIGNAKAQLVAAFPWDPAWRRVAGWAGNEMILISKKISQTTYGTDTTVVINRLTGEQDELPLPDPEMHSSDGHWVWLGYNWTLSVYNPSLSQVVYPRHIPEERGLSFILKDLATGDSLGALPAESTFAPKWLPDGSRVIFSSPTTIKVQESFNDELFSMDNRGKSEQLTHFTTMVPENRISIFDYAISPDGQQVAFWVNYMPYKEHPNSLSEEGNMALGSLAILDLETGIVRDLCVPQSYDYSIPIWSPDSRFILMDIEHPSSGRVTGTVYVIDVESTSLFQFAKDLFPVGWLSNE